MTHLWCLIASRELVIGRSPRLMLHWCPIPDRVGFYGGRGKSYAGFSWGRFHIEVSK